jgi:hypothetical protein
MDARYHISERQLGQCPCHSKWNLTGDWKKEHTQIFDIAISHRFGQVLSVKQHEGGSSKFASVVIFKYAPVT